jgi:WD40 repeat protein
VPGEELPSQAAKQIKEFEAEVEAIRKKADADIKARQDRLLQELQALQDSYTRAAKLDEAVAIRDRIRQLRAEFALPKPGVLPKTPADDVTRGTPPVGTPSTSPSVNPPKPGADRVTVPLPGAAREVCVGGAGRFLVLHLPLERQLAVFDADEARVVKYLPVAEDNVKIAAGLDKLFVVFPDKQVVQRWSLTNFEKEATAALPLTGQPNLVLMGSATNGPLVCGIPQGLVYVDAQTFKEIKLEKAEDTGWIIHLGSHPSTVAARISADGRVVAAWRTATSPSGLYSEVRTGNSIKRHYEHTSAGYIVPGPDGRHLFTGDGVYAADLKKVDAEQPAAMTVPALHGDYYLSLRNSAHPDPLNRGKWQVAVHLVGDRRPLVTINDLQGLEGANKWGRDMTSLDRRLFFIPRAKLLVVLPEPANKLLLHRFDLDEALEKAGVDYLLVTSRPVTTAVKGKAYTYKLAVKSKKGGVKYRLESAPAGMKLGDDGVLSWEVPAQVEQAEGNVLITVGDASGQEIFHSFTIAIKDTAEGAPPTPTEVIKPGEIKPLPVPLQPVEELRAGPDALLNIPLEQRQRRIAEILFTKLDGFRVGLYYSESLSRDGKEHLELLDPAGKKTVARMELPAARFHPCERDLSPDGKYFAMQTKLEGRKISIWEVGKPEPVVEDWSIQKPEKARDPWAGFLDSFYLLEGDRLVTFTGGGDMEVWQLPEMKSLLRTPAPAKHFMSSPLGRNNGVCVSPDRRLCAVFTGDNYRILDTQTGKVVCETPVLAAPKGSALTSRSCAFNPDGTLLAACIEGGPMMPALLCYDAKSGKEKSSVEQVPGQPHIFSRIGWYGLRHFYLSANRGRGKAELYCAEDGKKVADLVPGNNGGSGVLGFGSPDQRLWYATSSKSPGVEARLTAVPLRKEFDPDKPGQPAVWKMSDQGLIPFE